MASGPFITGRRGDNWASTIPAQQWVAELDIERRAMEFHRLVSPPAPTLPNSKPTAQDAEDAVGTTLVGSGPAIPLPRRLSRVAGLSTWQVSWGGKFTPAAPWVATVDFFSPGIEDFVDDWLA